jgi:hypothetical protein
MMATDYDAPRRTETDDVSEDSLEELKARRNEAASAVVDVDESTCSSCFLVQHRSRLASEKGGVMICTDCAA